METTDRMPFDFPQTLKDLSQNIIKVIGVGFFISKIAFLIECSKY